MKKLITALIFFCSLGANAQVRFSVAPDLSLMRNFSPKQKFWALGQTVQFNFHFTKRETAYAWLTYYTAGKFKNNFVATAKSGSTNPQTIPFRAAAKWRNNEVSLGWKHYFKGDFDAETGWGFYGTAGFGLMFIKVENVFTPGIDTSLYFTPLRMGNDEFKRLTIDLGMGVELPLGGDFFLYSDVRTWIPTSNYPSPSLHNNKNVPLPFMIAVGLRVLFRTAY